MAAPEELGREELISLLVRRDARIAAQNAQITALSTQVADLLEANKALASKLAKVEHLLSRNSQNSSSPPSKDDDVGRMPPTGKPKRRFTSAKRKKGKQPGAAGTNLAFTENPTKREQRLPTGRGECGHDLAQAVDLGVADRYQQHEIPRISVTVTQYDQHWVRCCCGRVHTATRPAGARAGAVGYGPVLQAFVVYLMTMHHIPAHRCVALLESLTGAAPSVGFVHGMLQRTAAVVAEVDQRIAALLTQAYAVCADETPIRVGGKKPKPGRKKADKYLLVACTERFTHYLLGDRDLDTFKAFVLQDLATSGAVVVHDRYHLYDHDEIGTLTHQLCCAHLCRDLDGAAEVYPDAHWPTQIATALRGLIHQANLARDAGQHSIPAALRDTLIKEFTNGVLVGLSETTSHGDRPGQRKARLLLEVLRDRPGDVLRFTSDLRVPPTSNQAERDLRPAKLQQKISGRLTSDQRTKDRYRIRGYLSTAVKHGVNAIDALRQAMLEAPWTPPQPAST